MKKSCMALLFLCLSLTSLSGCKKAVPPTPRIVSGVTVQWCREGSVCRRTYRDTEKIEAVLLYLRLLKTETPPEDPERKSGSVYKITLELADGTKHIFRQKQHRYFQKGSQAWTSVSPEQAVDLYDILRQYESDPALLAIVCTESVKL